MHPGKCPHPATYAWVLPREAPASAPSAVDYFLSSLPCTVTAQMTRTSSVIMMTDQMG